MRSTPGGGSVVAEMQGLDGAFSFAEKLLQKIWQRGDFERDGAVTSCGDRVTVVSPGKWNRYGGPDFLGARILLGGKLQVGDVELHLHSSDWRAHGHTADPKYRNVVLHVVLFPTPPEEVTIGWEGQRLPILALLPLLRRSLEEYADEEAVERLANHPLAAAQDVLGALGTAVARQQIMTCAKERWHQKVYFARQRVARLGWDKACHHGALEVLGYRFNRGAMLTAAESYPLSEWRNSSAAEMANRVFETLRSKWNVHPVRPANHPRTRLTQYAEWICSIADWPSRLASVALLPVEANEKVEPTTAQFRLRPGFKAARDVFFREICGTKVGGTRFDTLVCNAFLPLLATQDPTLANRIGAYWENWYAGDLPAKISQLLRALGLIGGANCPASNGIAQGLLGWIWREEERGDQTTACLCGRGT